MQLLRLSFPWLLLLRAGAAAAFCLAPSMTIPTRRFADNNNNNSNNLYADELRASAQKLRDEAARLESALDRKPEGTTLAQQATSTIATSTGAIDRAMYTSLEDSIWSLKYRFTSDPLPDDTKNQNDQSSSSSLSSQQQQQQQPSTYSGTLTVQFRSDGYTNLLGSESTGAGSGLEIVKVWGWDKERSNDNADNKDKDQEYLLFSTTIQLPASDTTAPNTQLRFYWQGRIVKTSSTTTTTTTTRSNVLSIVDGTVTVKKDAVAPIIGGLWGGLFRGSGGILAQFRQVGNFVAKPTTIKAMKTEEE